MPSNPFAPAPPGDAAVVEGSPEGDALGTRLLEAATAEFAARGYAGARVAEIARRAGVTTGAIYSRYRGKADLLAAALADATEDEFDALFADHRFQGRMEDILLIAGSHLVEAHSSDDNAATPGMLLESFAAARHEPEVAAIISSGMNQRRDRLAEIVDSAKEQGGIDPSLDTEAVVTFCHAVGLGFLLLEVADLPRPAAGEWEALISRLVASVAPPS
jgi:AcrR family transcriptional regulator